MKSKHLRLVFDFDFSEVEPGGVDFSLGSFSLLVLGDEEEEELVDMDELWLRLVLR